jgi:heme O synthase-like polyprenyltransferase
VVLAVLAGQLFVGWSNDYLDRRLDAEAGREDKPLARGELEPRTVAIAAAVALVAVIPFRSRPAFPPLPFTWRPSRRRRPTTSA